MVCHMENRSPCARVAPLVAEITDGTDHFFPGAERIQAKLCPVGFGEWQQARSLSGPGLEETSGVRVLSTRLS